MARAFSEIAFTPAVRATQTAQGSADGYAKFLAPEADRGDRLSDKEIDFITSRDGFYQATVSETGWPYVQFRGGPRGFVKILDDRTIAYADFRGNRQYLSVGNLVGNDRVSLILMDYPNQARLKILGHARIIEDDKPEILKALTNPGDTSPITRGFLIDVAALEWNCPKYITPRFTVEEIKSLAQSNAQ